MGQKKGNVPRAVVPVELKQNMIEEYHAGIMASHFSGSTRLCQNYGGGRVCTSISLIMPEIVLTVPL